MSLSKCLTERCKGELCNAGDFTKKGVIEKLGIKKCLICDRVRGGRTIGTCLQEKQNHIKYCTKGGDEYNCALVWAKKVNNIKEQYGVIRTCYNKDILDLCEHCKLLPIYNSTLSLHKKKHLLRFTVGIFTLSS